MNVEGTRNILEIAYKKKCMHSAYDKQVLNIGTSDQITINELARKIKQLTNSSSAIVHIPYDLAYGPGYEDMKDRLPDLTKARVLLGYQFTVGIEEGLLRTILWYYNPDNVV